MLCAVPESSRTKLMQQFVPAGNRDGTTVLDREFGATSLSPLRAAALEAAKTAGLGDDRAIDVMLAMHELAANVVRHGTGRGRLQMEVTRQALICQVTDDGGAGQASQLGRAAPWPVQHGHGLWLVRLTADQIQVATGPGGSAVCVIFLLR
jgi:anti-sigma regulatory factor (Ser/Thr protein kinase)